MGSYEQTMVKLEKMAQQTNAQQMSWQEKMSKSSHQMEVADLVKAGLNPVLSSGGSGAQSYTTSLDSAASAVGNLASAHESASATRYAAQQSAAATRAAAAANLAAAREAAAASRYAADRGYESTKYQTDHSKSGSAAGVLSNLINSALKNPTIKKAANRVLSAAQTVRNNPSKYVYDPNSKFVWKNFNAYGKSKIRTQFNKFGVSWTAYNRDVFVDAYWNHNKNAMRKWTAILNNYYRNNSNSSRSYPGIKR